MNERLNHRGIDNIQARHLKRQSQRRRAMKRRRIIFFTVLSLIVLSVILFFTPLFNIKSVEINGNSKIDTALIKQTVGAVEEENLFRLNTKKITKRLSEIPYVESSEIRKSIFPVALKVDITECQPMCFISYNEQFVILDKNMKVLEISAEKYENLCEITGFGITTVSEGSIAAGDDIEKQTVLLDCIKIMSEQEIISNVYSINVADLNNLTFNYENRLDVVCGSTMDFSKKIGMFHKALNSDRLTANSRGTIDVSIVGKAIYTP